MCALAPTAGRSGVGVSSGRIYSLFYKETISLCLLDLDGLGDGGAADFGSGRVRRWYFPWY